MKSDRLRKLELELRDLEEWVRLGFVPKAEMEKHKQEIGVLTQKIEEEKARMKSAQEGGVEDLLLARRTKNVHEGGYVEYEQSSRADDDDDDDDDEEEEEDDATEEDDDASSKDESDDPFSDRNRWKRGLLMDEEE